MKLSIITPVYNGESYIAGCIQNVIDQNSDRVEHLIIDAASTDRTVEIIQSYADRYPHIRWISEPDRGQSDAMNKGVNQSQGEILGFLNVDDYYEPNALNRAIAHFDRLPSPSLLVGNCNILGSDEQLKYVNRPTDLNPLKLMLHRVCFPMNPAAYFYHKTLHQRIGPYPIEEHYMMDIDFILKATQQAQTHYVDELFGNHRQIEGTKTVNLISSGNHEQQLSQLLKFHRRNLSWDRQPMLLLYRIGYRLRDLKKRNA